MDRMIRNYEDLAALYEIEDAASLKREDLERRISHGAYKYTSCGAWVAFEEFPGKEKKTSWFVEVSESIIEHVFILRARRAGRKEWIQPPEFPPRLIEWLGAKEEKGRWIMGDILRLTELRNLQEKRNRDDLEMPWFIRQDRGCVLQVEVRGIKVLGPSRLGIAVGSIVEGVDQTTEVHNLMFPFRESSYWQALDDVEKEAKEIWNETHGCEKCGPEDEMTGYRPINPNCPECKGEGIVI